MDEMNEIIMESWWWNGLIKYKQMHMKRKNHKKTYKMEVLVPWSNYQCISSLWSLMLTNELILWVLYPNVSKRYEEIQTNVSKQFYKSGNKKDMPMTIQEA